jgi:hypothetical protein
MRQARGQCENKTLEASKFSHARANNGDSAMAMSSYDH